MVVIKDLRFGLPIIDITESAKNSGFGVFRKVAEAGGVEGDQHKRRSFADTE